MKIASPALLLMHSLLSVYIQRILDLIWGEDFLLSMKIMMNVRRTGENCSEQSMVTSVLDLPGSYLTVQFHCCMDVACQHFTKTFLSETAP